MKTALRRFFRAVAFLLSVLVLGSTGYILMGWTPIDALYMVVITIFSVGYGEVEPVDTTWLKVYTICVIFAGTGSSFYILGTIVQMITEGQLQQALGARRMSQGIRSMKDHAIVCGFGRIGRIVSKQLRDSKYPFVIIDASESRVHEAEALGYMAMVGSALEEADLRAVHIERAKFFATVLPSDADNVFITLSARNLNPDLTIIARGEMPNTEKKLRQAGASHVIMPADIGGRRIAELILYPGDDAEHRLERVEMMRDDLHDMGLEVRTLPVDQWPQLIGISVNDISVSGEDPHIVVGVRNSEGDTVCGPHGSRALAAGDRVVAIGAQGDEPKLSHRMH